MLTFLKSLFSPPPKKRPQAIRRRRIDPAYFHQPDVQHAPPKEGVNGRVSCSIKSERVDDGLL